MKFAIFLDIDGVLNGIDTDTEAYTEYEKARNNHEINLEEKLKFYDKINIEKAYLSEQAIKRLKEICDMTGAVIVLNGAQSKQLYEGTWFNTNFNPNNSNRHLGYITIQGEKLMDLFKKYDIPVEGYSFDNTIDTYKPAAMIKYLKNHTDIDSALIVEDVLFQLGKQEIKDYISTELGNENNQTTKQLINNLTDKNAILVKKLTDERKDKIIERINELKELSIKNDEQNILVKSNKISNLIKKLVKFYASHDALLTQKDIEELEKHLNIVDGKLQLNLKGLNLAVRKGLLLKALKESGLDVEIKGIEILYSSGKTKQFDKEFNEIQKAQEKVLKETNEQESKKETIPTASKSPLRQSLEAKILQMAAEIEANGSNNKGYDDFSL